MMRRGVGDVLRALANLIDPPKPIIVLRPLVAAWHIDQRRIGEAVLEAARKSSARKRAPGRDAP